MVEIKTMNRRSKAKAKSKSMSLAGPVSRSGQGKFPAKLTNLRGEIETPSSSPDKKKKSVKGPPTQLKIEKAVEGNLAKLRLDEENTTTSTPKPEEKNTNWAVMAEKPIQFPFRHPCELCNVFGHWHHFCPYLECIPDNVTQVPKGYEICYERGVRYAEMINCVLCGKFGDHVSKNCSERSKFMAIIDSVIGISRPSPSSY